MFLRELPPPPSTSTHPNPAFQVYLDKHDGFNLLLWRRARGGKNILLCDVINFYNINVHAFETETFPPPSETKISK